MRPKTKTAHIVTGDTVRIDALGHQPGWLTVFQVDSDGKFHKIYAPNPESNEPDIQPDCRTHIIDVTVDPPAGEERLVAIWSCRPQSLTSELLDRLAQQVSGRADSTRRNTTNKVTELHQSVQQAEPKDLFAIVVVVDHREE